MDPYITFDDPTLNIKSYLGSDYVVEYISSKLWYNHNYFLENYDHLPIKDIYIYIYIYIYILYTHYLNLAMLSRYWIIPSLAYEYPSLGCYFEISKYSPTWNTCLDPHSIPAFHSLVYQIVTFKQLTLIY